MADGVAALPVAQSQLIAAALFGVALIVVLIAR